MSGDEELYLIATNEVDGNNRNTALWAKCMAVCEGKEEKAKYMYINERVNTLRSEFYQDEKKKREIEKREIEKKILIRIDEILQDEQHTISELKKIKYYTSREPNSTWTVISPTGDCKFISHDGQFYSYARAALLKEAKGKIEIQGISSPFQHEIESVTQDKPFFQRLANGDYGLAKTYWLYYGLVNVIANIVFGFGIAIIEPTRGITFALILLIIYFVLYIIYSVLVIMGIWRAATKYTGPKIWAVLAKIVCVVGVLVLAVAILAIAGIMKNA